MAGMWWLGRVGVEWVGLVGMTVLVSKIVGEIRYDGVY